MKSKGLFVGDKRGKLEVVEIIKNENPNTYIYVCACECGNICRVRKSRFSQDNGKQCGDCFVKRVEELKEIKRKHT